MLSDSAQQTTPIDPLGFTLEGFSQAVRTLDAGAGQAERAYKQIFREGRVEGTANRGRVIARVCVPPIVKQLREDVPEGETIKFVQRLDAMPKPERVIAEDRRKRAIDGHPLGALAGDDRVHHLDIESVIIPMVGRSGTRTHTLCVSSQVGCAMGCGFCETAQMGLIRSLTAEEIVGQWWAATFLLGKQIDNIVFMGMGEPLDNIDEVIRAIGVLADHNGACVPMSRITVSTVGRIDGLRKLDEVVKREGWRRLGLAVSINAPNDTVRDDLMPVNRGMPMAELREVLLGFRRGCARKICFEYVLIPGVNDAREHASQLAEYLDPFKGIAGVRSPLGLVNVIPYNPRRDSPWPAPTEERVTEFMRWLSDDGLFVKRRRTKGRAMMGACGQLGTASIRKRKYVPLTTGSANGGVGV
ncbi:MAG: radical SAM protein [Planctomycetota bacterium]